MAIGVGYEWDACVITNFDSGMRRTIVSIEKGIKELIKRVWAKYNRSPFEKRKADDLPNPPRNWRETLLHYIVEKVIGNWKRRSKHKLLMDIYRAFSSHLDATSTSFTSCRPIWGTASLFMLRRWTTNSLANEVRFGSTGKH
jgi:hypothetical protein